MRKHFSIAILLLACASFAQAQTRPTPSPRTTAPPPQQQQQTARTGGFDLTDYGVRIQPEPRLIVMMAALDAAGFDPTPSGQQPTVFRAQVRRDLSGLDEGLRKRMSDFFERNKLRPQGARTPTPAEQAARYVSLAYALGPLPNLDAPARTDDLPAGLLEVLDFAPLVREFYRRSGIDERMPAYLRAYQEEGDQLRRPTADMVRFVLSYLHTRPETVMNERVPVRSTGTSSAQKKREQAQQPRYTVRERERRFFIVPDLLAAPGALNFRVIADDYYAIVPAGADPTSYELRRAYLQYVIDPLVLRFNRDISARRDAVKQLLDARAKAGASVTPDVFTAVSRSLVAGAEARLDEAVRLARLLSDARNRMAQTTDASARTTIGTETQAARAAIEDETVAQLADAYEGGAVLAFYFADQLRGVESSGFDISNFFADMIASFDPARESQRLNENKEARARALAARQTRLAQRQAEAAAPDEGGTEVAQRAALIKSLRDVEGMLQLRDYTGAEKRLKSLLQEFQGEPRIFFALAQTSSLWARETTDDDLQTARLNQALTHYRMAMERASADTDLNLICRAHEASGRILAFLEKPAEAMKEFDAVIGMGSNACGEAYKDAQAGKSKLSQQQ